MATALAHFGESGTLGSGSSTKLAYPGDSHGHPRECSHKDFMNCKLNSFDGNGAVISLMRWFKKTDSVFKIYCALKGAK